MRTLVAGFISAILFAGCQLEAPEDELPSGEGGESGEGSSGRPAGKGGSSGSSAGQAPSAGKGGSMSSAGSGGSGGSKGGSGPAGGASSGGKSGSGALGGAGSGNAGSGGSAQGGSSNAGTASGGDSGSGGCTPNLGCELDVLPSTGDLHQDCVDRINQFRTQCACLPALERWTEGEACADQMAEYDSTQEEAHAGFRDDICSGGSAQNECPGWRDEEQVVEGCLQMMWDEGPPPTDPCEDDCFQEHGHFINMSSTRYTQVACGFYTTPGDEVWSVQNFSR